MFCVKCALVVMNIHKYFIFIKYINFTFKNVGGIRIPNT